MSNQIAVGQCSTEEDLDIEWSFVSGYDPTGKAFEVNLRDRSSSTVRTTLTVGSGLTIVGAAVKAKVAKTTMAAWPRTEYSADLVDKTGGAFKRVVPTRFIFDEPGKLVGGAGSNAFQITAAGNSFVVTATRGETGPVGPATTLTIGTVTDIAAGNPPTASLTGPAGAQVLNLGLVRGTPGAGAPTSADILAIGEKGRIERALAAAGIPDEPSVILDFIRGVHFISKAAVAASIATLIAALPGSSFTRASTGTFWDVDGLLKTAAANVPRQGYDPVTRLPRGQLDEPSRTNLFTYSDQFDNAAWLKGALTVTANAAVGPYGSATMDKLVESTSNATHNITRSVTSVSGAAHTLSFVVKAAERSNLTLRLDDGATLWAQCVFNLVAGTYSGLIGSGASADIQNCGAGLYRIELTGISTSTTARAVAYLHNGVSEVYAGDGASGLYIECGQLEVGGQSSSIIQTGASAVTRAADYYAIIPPSGLLSQTTGTLLVEFSSGVGPAGSNNALIGLDDQPVGLNSISFTRNSAGPGALLCVANGSAVIVTTSGMAWPANGIARAAVRYAPNDITRSWLGAAVISATGFTAFSAPLTAIRPTLVAPGYVRRIMYFPPALSDAKLQALSNPTAWS